MEGQTHDSRTIKSLSFPVFYTSFAFLSLPKIVDFTDGHAGVWGCYLFCQKDTRR